MIHADLPPKLWLPPKPAIVRAASLKDVELVRGARREHRATFPFPVFVPTGYRAAASGSFNGTNTALTRTYGATSNRKTHTISIWAKRGAIGSAQFLLAWNDGSANSMGLKFDASDHLEFFSYATGYQHRQVSAATFTSTSAFIHIVAANDTPNGTATDRNRLWVDGAEMTSFSTDTQNALNADNQLNVTGRTYKVGNDGQSAATAWFNGLLAEIVVIDGQQLDPTSFGQMDGGVWRPKAISGLSFGTNGFYLRFANAGALGEDSSGNGNNWTNSNVTQSSEVP